jgi:parallel beta helix pectate lyase-like protein
VIENSLIADNSPNALYLNDQGSGGIVVRNSTITGNEGAAFLYTAETATITFVGTTIADNAPNGGAGIYIQEGGAWTAGTTFEDSIIWGNASAPIGNDPEIKGPAKAAFSLIGEPKGLALTETIPGSNLLGVDPQLHPLDADGGPTPTMAVGATSPVVNKGAAFGLTTDGRGDGRPSIFPGVALATAPGADGSDIGAYELQAPVVPPPAGPSSAGPSALAKGGPRSPKVRLHCAKSAGAHGCRFVLQVVSGKPKRAGGKVHQPTPESALAKLTLGAGKSGLLTLRPKAKFAARLDAAKTILVRETVTLEGRSTTSFRRLKVAG